VFDVLQSAALDIKESIFLTYITSIYFQLLSCTFSIRTVACLHSKLLFAYNDFITLNFNLTNIFQ